ncbi:MAG TPA: lysozyme inhibitor LprI family protein [Pyrinomonadaceae bacterium]|nr:lysozyme inhibitor LprI family protein [Pyrinomonadaceae bacterium]
MRHILKYAALMSLTLLVSASVVAQKQKKKEPCDDAQTQLEMNMCAGKAYKEADAELNRVYQKLISLLDDEQKTQLKTVETAWLKYRDANCEFVADQYKGGSMRPMIAGFCLADMTKNRTAELKSQIEDRSQ